MIVGSIGVVYGDIGTSPLYALRESLSHAAKADILTEEAVIGAISLLLYALIFTVTAKYVVFLMRADNRGEGGILSLMALAQTALGRRVGRRANLVFLLGVAGAALFSGDAIITPAISVLSAVEGLDLVTHRLDRICHSDHDRDPGDAVLGAEPGHGAGRGLFRPDHDRVFPDDRRARRDAHSRSAASAARFRSARGPALSDRPRLDRLRRARLGVSGRHRRRGALRRHGAFRPFPDPGRLDLLRIAGPAAELSRPGRADPFEARGHRKPVLPAGARMGCCCRWSFCRRWPRSSPARRSSPAPSRWRVRRSSSACCRVSRSPIPRRRRRGRFTSAASIGCC